MYIFRLAEIGTDDVNDWTSEGAITYDSISDPEYGLFLVWSPDMPQGYNLEEYVVKGVWIYVSLKDANMDDPENNYVGRISNNPDAESLTDYGNESWIRLRKRIRYQCFERVSTGFTWSYEDPIDMTITPVETMQDATFFGYNNSDDIYLILTELMGSRVIISILANDNTVLSSEEISLDYSEAIVADWVVNPELPGVKRNTILRKFDMSQGAYKVRIQLYPNTNSAVALKRSCIGGLYFGRPTYVGQTQQDKISFEFKDLSRVVEDDWGNITIQRGKVSKMISADVWISTPKAESVFRLLQYCRSTPVFALFGNHLDTVSAVGSTLTGINTVLGLITQGQQKKENAVTTSFSTTVEGIPFWFQDILLDNERSICGGLALYS